MLNVARLIGQFGTPDKLSLLLEVNGQQSVPADTIRKWRQRNSLPVQRLADILSLSRDLGRPINLYDYLSDDDG